MASGSSKGYHDAKYLSSEVVLLYTHRIFFLPRKLARSLEVDPKVRKLALIVLANVLDGVDMERHSKTMYR